MNWINRNSRSVKAARSDTARDALTELYTDQHLKLVAMLRHAFGEGPPEPEDALQQAFENVLARDDLDQIHDLRAFLWRTARNIIISGKRHIAVRTKYDFEIEHLFFAARGDNSGPENVISAEEQLREINRVLRRMPSRRRRAFLLHKLEGLSVSEVARRLGISRSPAVRHIQRAALEIAQSLELLNGDRSE
ncbi:MAG: sigma-70 family RNA polymerase sigma factor [Pseudomonadota bacterium]